MAFLRFLLLGLVVGGVTAACSSTPEEEQDQCPEISVLEDLGRVERFTPDLHQGYDNVRFRAIFTRALSTCDVDYNQIAVEAEIEVAAVRGPALRQSTVTANLVAIVAGADQSILARRLLPVQFHFADSGTEAVHREQLHIDIPKQAEQKPEDFAIYLGFQLTQAEIRANRALK